MKWQLFSGTVLVFIPALLVSQVSLNPASSPNPTDDQARVSQSNQQIVSLSGKVTSEDGSALSDRATVILQCGNQERARVNTDREGGFSISLAVPGNESGATAVSGIHNQPTTSVPVVNLNECELYGDAPGYTSEHVHMFGGDGVGVMQVGTVIMHPLKKQPGSFAVSVASLQAPDKAKKNFEKGQEQEQKGKWAAARDCFRKAVKAYPRYALAWLELGRTQLKQNDFAEAQQSFHQAAEQDPHFLDAYIQIASLAAQKQNWKELVDATDHLVQLSPDSSPNFWFMNSAANFNLGNIAQAETSATRGLRMDPNHKLPQLEYLYGIILARRGDFKAAVPHVETYLRLSPHAKDAQDAQTKLAEFKKLATTEKVASR